jgi:hypothetical protein
LHTGCDLPVEPGEKTAGDPQEKQARKNQKVKQLNSHNRLSFSISFPGMFPDLHLIIQPVNPVFMVFFRFSDPYRTGGALPDERFQGGFIGQIVQVVTVCFKPEKVGHQGAKRTDDHTGFTGYTEVYGTNDHSVRIFFEGFGRAYGYAGSIGAFPAGKPENCQFPHGFQPVDAIGRVNYRIGRRQVIIPG